MQAEITYTRDTGEKLVNETFGPNNIRRRTSGMEERHRVDIANGREARDLALDRNGFVLVEHRTAMRDFFDAEELKRDRKSTRLNSSHRCISYAVFCLKKKKKKKTKQQ